LRGPTVGEPVELVAGAARAVVDPVGSRLASLTVDGRELLLAAGDDPLLWGCYPMVPWAGRLGEGRFTFSGETTQVPVDHPPHAIHGLGKGRRWTHLGDARFSLELADLWPLAGRASTRVDLTDSALTLVVEARAGHRPMPVVLGWHPCFRRRLTSDGDTPVQLLFDPARVWARGADGLPSGERGPVPPGPWDDCFDGVTTPPVLRWPGGPTLTLTADTDTWVVYDERDDVLCVEPQTGPPDAFNLGAATTLDPGEATRLALTLSWG
jgi:galactose mutarotase-like enzyme